MSAALIQSIFHDFFKIGFFKYCTGIHWHISVYTRQILLIPEYFIHTYRTKAIYICRFFRTPEIESVLFILYATGSRYINILLLPCDISRLLQRCGSVCL